MLRWTCDDPRAGGPGERSHRGKRATQSADAGRGRPTARPRRKPTAILAPDATFSSCPDVLCNAGGVTVSYFEWVQDTQNYSWTLDEINGRLRRRSSWTPSTARWPGPNATGWPCTRRPSSKASTAWPRPNWPGGSSRNPLLSAGLTTSCCGRSPDVCCGRSPDRATPPTAGLPASGRPIGQSRSTVGRPCYNLESSRSASEGRTG